MPSSAMLTACKTWSSDRERAEVPHPEVANALTGFETGEHGSAPVAQGDIELTEPVSKLIAQAKAGDAKAFDQLLASQRARAMAAAVRVLHNPDDAEDAVQDAFLKIWRCLPSFAGRSSFATWVHRIVVNASLDFMRKQAARPELVERPEQKDDVAMTAVEPVHDQTPESELGDRELEKLVRLAVAALPAAHRQVVELREFEDYSYQEMAELIPCPLGTVMSRLHHARGRLAQDLRAPLADALAA
jgi:RNA polymerase sigma-70 factor, ECF subfamily